MSDDLVVATQTVTREQGQSILKLIQELHITDTQTYQLGVDLVRRAKKILTAIESKFDVPVKAAYDAHRKAVHLRDEALGGFEEAERLGKHKIALYAQETGDILPDIPGLVLTRRWGVEVTDPELVPAEYRVIDTDKIRKVAQALKEETRIPGVKVWPITQVSVRADPE